LTENKCDAKIDIELYSELKSSFTMYGE